MRRDRGVWRSKGPAMGKMKATVFHGKNDIRVEQVERPPRCWRRSDTYHSYYHLWHGPAHCAR